MRLSPRGHVTKEQIAEYARAAHVRPTIAALLLLRHVPPEAAQEFLHPANAPLHDPLLFSNMAICIQRIRQALSSAEPIAVYADYDADGTCACAILCDCLETLGGDVRAYIPDRFTEGYGTNADAIRRLAGEGTKLLITVDCGIRSVEDVRLARELGMDTIIFDHHECGELPDTPYIVDPKRPGEAYPFDGLCGAGLACKAAWALLGPAAEKYMDIAALATIGDMVPLRGENRTIAARGLEKMRNMPAPGIAALAKAAGIGRITAQSVAFGLVPRINAAGRMDTAFAALELLRAQSEQEAGKAAEKLCALNAQRKNAQQRITDMAVEMVRQTVNLEEDRVIMAAGEGWDKGVVGLAASAIAERFSRPAVIFSRQDDMLVGSARSIDGVNIYEALCAAQARYTKFGGHSQAAGLSMPAHELDAARREVNAYLRTTYDDAVFLPKATYDLAIDPRIVDLPLAEDMELLEPCGVENPPPCFVVRNLQPKSIREMGGGRHARFSDGASRMDYVRFRMESAINPSDAYTAVGSVSLNEFRGRRTVQMICNYLLPSQNSISPAPDERQELRELAAYAGFLADANRCSANRETFWQRLSDSLAAGPFGTMLSICMPQGAEIAGQAALHGFERISRQLSQDTAENTLLIGAGDGQSVCGYGDVFGAYAFSTNCPHALHLWDAELHEAYMQSAETFYVAGETLATCASAAKRAAEAGEYASIRGYLQACMNHLSGITLKKMWFAVKVFLDAKLIEVEKRDKIRFIYNDAGKAPAQSATYAALRAILGART